MYIPYSPIQKCSTLTLRVNTKNISLAYLLANYLKFSAPSFIFFYYTKYLLQKEMLGCKKIIGQSSMKGRGKKRKIYEPKFIIKFQVQSWRNHFK